MRHECPAPPAAGPARVPSGPLGADTVVNSRPSSQLSKSRFHFWPLGAPGCISTPVLSVTRSRGWQREPTHSVPEFAFPSNMQPFLAPSATAITLRSLCCGMLQALPNLHLRSAPALGTRLRRMCSRAQCAPRGEALHTATERSGVSLDSARAVDAVPGGLYTRLGSTTLHKLATEFYNNVYADDQAFFRWGRKTGPAAALLGGAALPRRWEPTSRALPAPHLATLPQGRVQGPPKGGRHSQLARVPDPAPRRPARVLGAQG